jgi:3-oxoacyl-[acyl-carrier-protein] synthase III
VESPSTNFGASNPHQANIRIIETMAKEMKTPDSVQERRFDIRTNGKTFEAASILLRWIDFSNSNPVRMEN